MSVADAVQHLIASKVQAELGLSQMSAVRVVLDELLRQTSSAREDFDEARQEAQLARGQLQELQGHSLEAFLSLLVEQVQAVQDQIQLLYDGDTFAANVGAAQYVDRVSDIIAMLENI